MVQDDARSTDRLARAAHRNRAWAARLMREGAGPGGGEIACDDEAGVGRSRNAGTGECQVIEIVGARATDQCSSASEGHQAGAAGVSAIIGPISSHRVRK